MRAQHTAGLIRYDYEPGYCGELISRDGMTVAAFDSEPSEADARRLVACWNACEGLHTESLECGKPLAAQIVDALNQRHELMVRLLEREQEGPTPATYELMAQRDALLEALKDVRGDLFMQISNRHGAKAASEYPSIVRAKAAITKTEGSAA